MDDRASREVPRPTSAHRLRRIRAALNLAKPEDRKNSAHRKGREPRTLNRRTLNFEQGNRGPGLSVQGSRFKVQGSKFRVQGSRFKVQGSGSRFRVQGSGFKVQGSRFRGSGFKVQGSRFRVQDQEVQGSRFKPSCVLCPMRFPPRAQVQTGRPGPPLSPPPKRGGRMTAIWVETALPRSSTLRVNKSVLPIGRGAGAINVAARLGAKPPPFLPVGPCFP